MIIITAEALSSEALMGVIDNFVLREGTDYGHRDVTLEEKRSHVKRLLERGEAQIQYCPDTEFIDIQLC